jgi:hypothetical protein
VNAGCGDKPGRLSLFDTSADAGSETATFVSGIIDNAVSIDVEIVTVDEYCDANGIERIDLLKMDVEGFEVVVLRGSQRMLSERRVAIVQFEFNEMNLASHTTLEDMQMLLPSYSLHRVLYDGNLLPLHNAPPYRRNIFVYQNMVAILKG